MNLEDEFRGRKTVPKRLADGWELLCLDHAIGANRFLIIAEVQTPLSYAVSAIRENGTLSAYEERLPLNV